MRYTRIARPFANWLAPLHAAVLTALKADRVLHVDETVLPLQAPGKTLKVRAWAYVGTEVKLIHYDFTLSKHGHHVRERLADWGSSDHPVYLQADRASRAAAMRRRSSRSERCREATDAANNYDGLYGQYPHIREVACWAHARRKFFEIAKHGNTPTASGALERINALFDLERQASEAGLDHDDTRRWRAEHAKPKLDELDRFLKDEQQQLLPNTPTMAAIGYVQNHWPAFTRYLEHGQCVIDNNAAERALRVVAVGRKNLAVRRQRTRRPCRRHLLHPHRSLRDSARCASYAFASPLCGSLGRKRQGQRPQPPRLPRRHPAAPAHHPR